MKITITIDNTENAAFGETPEDRAEEICRIIRAAGRICEGRVSFDEAYEAPLRDVNGNAVGKIAVSQ